MRVSARNRTQNTRLRKGLGCWENAPRSAHVPKHAPYMLYLIMTFILLTPSVLVSVKNREKTNTVVSGVISLLGFFSYLIIAATENIVSVEHVCYSLQFCLCYASYCVWQEASGNRLLFACNDFVKYVSAVATYAFPVILSHALVNGMHPCPPTSFRYRSLARSLVRAAE